MMKKNILTTTVIFQIFLLAITVFANSYNLHSSDLIPVVSAEDSFSCCPKTNDGAICQDVSSDYSNCAEELLPTKCDYVAKCKLGCCIDEKEGLCTTNSPKGKCEEDGGIWQEDKNCNTFECQKGCCVLGEKVEFITEDRCDKLSLLFGFDKDFRDLETELECFALEKSQPEGACIFNGGVCKFTTESECRKLGGKFSEGNLCSKESLNTICERQASIGCVEGKDEIYWFDSCGNKENIYSSNKDASWNNGEVLKKEDSCGAGSSNINSKSCGNCNYFLGSKCAESSSGKARVDDGNFVCKNLNCIDENGKERVNGESWCVYDSFIGDGKDAVGSRHWKRMCINGEIKVEPCADYRGQICVQSNINGTGRNFSIAACVINEATKCLSYNSNQDMDSCRKNEYCVVKEINVDSGFQFDVCVGKYPKGFDLTGEEYLESRDMCGIASQKCEVLYVKDWKGHWKCKKNCNCESEEFSKQMNDLCVSLGDCGSYINYIGDGTDNSDVENAPEIPWQDYKKFAEPVKGLYAEAKDIEEVLEVIKKDYRKDSNAKGQEKNSFAEGIKLLGTISSSTGSLISGLAWAGGSVKIIGAGQTIPSGAQVLGGSVVTGPAGGSSLVAGEGGTLVATKGAIGGRGLVGTTLGSVGAAAGGIGIGMTVGSFAAKAFGIKGNAATFLSLAGGIAGGIAGYGAFAYSAASTAAGGGAAGAAAGSSAAGGLGGISTFGGSSLFTGSFGPMMAAFAWAVIVVVVLAVVIKIIGWGDTKIVTVQFECMPWEAPLGGDNCNKCNDDPLKPCSKYRCESLGQACILLNEDTENPVCESLPKEDNPPVISTGEILDDLTFLNTGESKTEISEIGKKCITEFKPVLFSLNTDEYAQCKYSFEKTKNYDEMEQFPLEQNKFSKNHTFAFSIPSVDSLNTYNTIKNISEMFSEMNMYIRCQDVHGNYNKDEYTVHFCINSGPDITPPILVATNPKHNSYVKYGTKEIPAEIYLNEPSDCKYDTRDVSYEAMSHNMTCFTELLQLTDFGWKCSTTLKGFDKEENKFYIRCKDQPWLVNDSVKIVNEKTNETTYKTRNVNTESFIFTLKSSLNKLNITSISPKGEISGGFEPITVDLEVKTSGGANNGEATCYYKFSENETETLFFDTFSNIHKQTFNSMMSGNYKIWVRCEDDAGNIAEDTTEFELNLDTKPPIVVRVYSEDGKIRLITNEEAECYYDFDRCNFNFENASSMTNFFSKEHKIEKISGQTYYVKCKDIWGNYGNGCSIIIKTFS